MEMNKLHNCESLYQNLHYNYHYNYIKIYNFYESKQFSYFNFTK